MLMMVMVMMMVMLEEKEERKKKRSGLVQSRGCARIRALSHQAASPVLRLSFEYRATAAFYGYSSETD